jgi:hypothetical protein
MLEKALVKWNSSYWCGSGRRRMRRLAELRMLNWARFLGRNFNQMRKFCAKRVQNVQKRLKTFENLQKK